MGGETVAIQSSLIWRLNKKIEGVVCIGENDWGMTTVFYIITYNDMTHRNNDNALR